MTDHSMKEIAERAFAQAIKSVDMALKSPFRAHHSQADRTAAIEWFQIAAAALQSRVSPQEGLAK